MSSTTPYMSVEGVSAAAKMPVWDAFLQGQHPIGGDEPGTIFIDIDQLLAGNAPEMRAPVIITRSGALSMDADLRGRIEEIDPVPDHVAQTVPAPRFAALRVSFALFLAMLTCGLLLSSFALATGAGASIKGLAVIMMWASQAVVAVTVHREGRRSGEYLLGERASLPIAVFAVGMVIVAAVATMEFSLR